MPAFCTEDDVREALQEQSLSGPINQSLLAPAIDAASRWLANAANGHWYDSSNTLSGTNVTVDGGAATASNVRLSIPSSPHRQRGQIFASSTGSRAARDVVYPVADHGPYAKIPLPHPYVQSLSKLEVRDPGGDIEDWVAKSDIDQGRGNDYYVQRIGQQSYGRTALYVRVATVGPRHDFDGILTLEYDHGLDWANEEWWDVRRGVAALAAAQSVDDDDVISQIPDNGQLVNVQTQADALMQQAQRYLSPYINTIDLA